MIPDDRSINKVNLVETAKDQGYEYAWDRKTFNELEGPKALALVQDDAYIRPHAIRGYRKGDDPHFVPVQRLLVKAIEIGDENPEGFFVAADIDELDDAGHEHDGKAPARWSRSPPWARAGSASRACTRTRSCTQCRSTSRTATRSPIGPRRARMPGGPCALRDGANAPARVKPGSARGRENSRQ